MINSGRVEAVARAIASLGYDGIVRFDQHEPEYVAFSQMLERGESSETVHAIAVAAGIVDYALPKGGAHAFWRRLSELHSARVSEAGPIALSEEALWELMLRFARGPACARRRRQKVRRLERLFAGRVIGGILSNLEGYVEDPIRLQSDIARALKNRPTQKTVVFAVKAFDLAHLAAEGEYLRIPADFPIPVDCRVVEVAKSSGIVEGEASPREVIEAWRMVLDAVNERLERPVNIFRLDSVVWQAGAASDVSKSSLDVARSRLVAALVDGGVPETKARALAAELLFRPVG